MSFFDCLSWQLLSYTIASLAAPFPKFFNIKILKFQCGGEAYAKLPKFLPKFPRYGV
jgi:hypothetical protein